MALISRGVVLTVSNSVATVMPVFSKIHKFSEILRILDDFRDFFLKFSEILRDSQNSRFFFGDPVMTR